jgi:acetyltransferase EpsM
MTAKPQFLLEKSRLAAKQMKTRLVILGGPGDGDVVAEALHHAEAAGGDLTLHGFLNDALEPGSLVAGAPVLGRFEDWVSLPDDIRFIPVVHKVLETPRRVARIRSLNLPDDRLASVIHPTACIARDVTIGPGSFIASHVTIQPGARLGKVVTIRAGASIGHDAEIGDFVYVGPNATLCGRAILEEGAHMGPNSVLLDRRIVGAYCLVGIGAAVMKNFPPFSVLSGNPARRTSSVPGAPKEGDHG